MAGKNELTAIIGLVHAAVVSGAGLPSFQTHLLADDLKGGYQVVAADINGDGRKDLIALASGMAELVWFENPGHQGAGWPRHVMAKGMRRMINLCACAGADGRIGEIVLAQDFSSRPSASAGTVMVLRKPERAEDLWQAEEIDRLPTSHRLRCAKIPALGGTVIVNAPLAGAKSEPPEYRDKVPLVYYKPGEWKRRIIGEEADGVMHGIFIADWDGDASDEILTASFTGIRLHQLAGDGSWRARQITRGDPAPWPRSGSSDIAVGQLAGERFLAAIEPWHGHQLAVYSERNGEWPRKVIDSSLLDGHTVLAVDLDGDRRDEIVAGFRGKGHSVYIYEAASDGGEWKRTLLDDAVAAAGCDTADFNGDGRADLACIGSSTANLKWYENRARH